MFYQVKGNQKIFDDTDLKNKVKVKRDMLFYTTDCEFIFEFIGKIEKKSENIGDFVEVGDLIKAVKCGKKKPPFEIIKIEKQLNTELKIWERVMIGEFSSCKDYEIKELYKQVDNSYKLVYRKK